MIKDDDVDESDDHENHREFYLSPAGYIVDTSQIFV